MEDFIRGLPKAELHVHLEGTLEPDLMRALARRNRMDAQAHDAEGRPARFANLQAFLDIYYNAASTLRTEQDFYDLTRAYLRRARRDNARHVEPFFDPQTHTARGVPFEAVVTGIHRALEDGGREYAISSRLIMCFLRHLSAADAMATLEQALRMRDLIAGVGLDSGEIGNPPSKFTEVFARARQAGMHVVAHAGEEGPPDYIREALDLLGAERIDHGVRAIEDASLMARLKSEQVPLTVCPLSNVKLGVFASMERHDLKTLLDAGLMVTINSDDPAYFGGYVGDNYAAAQAALGLTRAEIVTIAVNSFRASFLNEDEKRAFIGEVQRYADGARTQGG